MKKKHLNICGQILAWGILLFCAACMSACRSDDAADSSEKYDPSRPVTVTDFIPKTGGVAQRLVVYGSNFGNDASNVKVTIGGQRAILISVKGDCLYCLVPAKAYTGEIVVSVGGKTANEQSATASSKFNYERKMVVGTLSGIRNQFDDQGWHDGPFKTATGFAGEGCLTFDPLYPNILYVVYDENAHGIQALDLEKKEVKTILSMSKFDNQRLRSIDFSHDGQYMLISTDRDDRQLQSPSVWIVKRNSDGTFTDDSKSQILAAYKQCNGAAVHPINGELYFNSYERGQVFRLNMDNYFNTVTSGGTWYPNWTDGNFKELFTIQDVSWEFKIFIHPTGKYCYIAVINKHYILRSDYNEITKSFAPPYVVAGQARNDGWIDGVGTGARVNRPYQGCFVKNKQYVAENRDDVYDFYFCDNNNHCIRYLTPDGIIRTYAGRGTSSQAGDGNMWGTEDGDLREVARFNSPTGIAYRESTNTFYILDTKGRKIRTISMEK